MWPEAEDLERIVAQQSARYAASASPSDMDDLRQEGMLVMLEVMASKVLPESPPAYLAGVCKRAMATWWGEYKGRGDAVFNEELAGWTSPDPERAIDKRRLVDTIKGRK